MITYMTWPHGTWRAIANDQTVEVTGNICGIIKKRFAPLGNPTDKDQFLAFVREHHDADTVEFVEKWIAAREPKRTYDHISGVQFTTEADGELAIGGEAEYVFDFASQREIIAKLTENLRRHGVEVTP